MMVEHGTDDELEGLFDRAVELDPPGRRALLDEVRGREPATARILEELLASFEARREFLTEPVSLQFLDEPDDAPVEAPESRRPETLIGFRASGFEVVRHIGSGGTGEVYEAVQERPRRRVALKVLADQHCRFSGEAETLARLDHPHVARVYGAGSAEVPSGTVCWMAVELLPAARTITDHAEASGLGLEERVRLFLPVCEAMHHAHRKGVLHRDLKPGNILVGEGGEGGAKVIDFGLARLLEPVDGEEGRRTRRGELLGTLNYMSPEQCAGDPALLDVRTDVYALGVVLYELLTGELPYELSERSLLAVLETIRSTPARDPRELQPELDDDLAAVLAGALSKEQEDRYDSAAALADDLERWLRREPVLARRSSLVHRVRLFARRRTTLFIGISVAATVATVLLTVVFVLFVAYRDKLGEIERAEADVREQRELVEEARVNLTQLQGILDSLLGAGEERYDATAAALVQTATAAQASADSPQASRQAVADAVERLRKLAGLLADDPESAASLAAAFVKVGDLHGREWNASPVDSEYSRQAYEEGVVLWRKVITSRPDDHAARKALVSALVRLAHAYRKEMRIAEGRKFAEEAVALGRRGVLEQPGESAAGRDLVEALWARGDLHIFQEPYEQGLIDSREAVLISETILAGSPGDVAAMSNLSWSLMRLGLWEQRLRDDLEAALAAHARAWTLREEILDAWLATPASPEAAEQTESAAKLLFHVFSWNELSVLYELERHAEVHARLAALVERVDPLLERDLGAAIVEPATAILVSTVDAADDPAERDSATRTLAELYAGLSDEELEPHHDETIWWLERFTDLGPEGLRLLEELRTTGRIAP